MRPSSEDSDFYDADVPTDANPSRLRQVILSQAFEPGGAVVLLFTSATLDGAGPASEYGSDRPAVEADVVEETAAELQLDAIPPDLFSADAYLLQSALGERLLSDRA